MLAKTSTLLVCLAAPSVLCQDSCIPPYTVVSGDTLYSIWQSVGQATSWDTFSTSVCLENNPSYTNGQACVTALGDPSSGMMPIGRQLTFNSVCNSGATTSQTMPQQPPPQVPTPSPSPVSPQTPATPVTVPQVPAPLPPPSGEQVPNVLCPALYFRGIGTPVNTCRNGLTRFGALCYPGSKPMGCPPTREYLRGLCYTPCNATYHEHASVWCMRNNDNCT
ncbi:g1001 [Coccomyxa elongata]